MGAHGAAEVLAGAAPIESEEVGDAEKKDFDEGELSSDEFAAPTEEEDHMLRKVPGSIPAIYIRAVSRRARRARLVLRRLAGLQQLPGVPAFPPAATAPAPSPADQIENGHAGALYVTRPALRSPAPPFSGYSLML